jgi:phenylpyruvate tautomerase PptA (4-oxalocrotonate tautomerase family)
MLKERPMPILDIELVVQPDEHLPANLASELADRIGRVFGSAAQQTWVKVSTILRDHYAENEAGSLASIAPVFVQVLKARLPAPEALAVEVAALTTVIAEVCRWPADQIHIVYQPPAAGRVAFGGQLVPA